MTKLAVVEMIGRLIFFGAAGIGMAFVMMSIALLLVLLGDKSTWLPSVSLAVRVLLRLVIAVLASTVFAVVWLFALYWNRAAIADPLIFAFTFLVSVFALRYAYLRFNPTFIAKLKHHASGGEHSE
jgi:hypothetical protein